MTGCEFPRLQLRGSAGFSPASLLIRLTNQIDEDARTKEVEKERKATSRILNSSQNQGSGIVTQLQIVPLLHRHVDRSRRDAVGDDHQTAGAGLGILSGHRSWSTQLSFPWRLPMVLGLCVRA